MFEFTECTVSFGMVHRSESVPNCVVVLRQLEFQLNIYATKCLNYLNLPSIHLYGFHYYSPTHD